MGRMGLGGGFGEKVGEWLLFLTSLLLSPPPPDETPKGCAKGRRVNAKCFLGVKSFETFEDSARLCGAGGGHLAMPRGVTEAEALAAYTKSFFGPGNWPAWIGVTDRHSEGVYVFQDGVRVAPGDQWYRHPQLGQPNGGAQENCVALSTDDGKWWDKDCGRRMYFICEYEY
ncbi:C-type lectin domain family 11 member A [Chiloscyllium plagiosum]|uniref:C-type lectin domain family 11 member A n=1 Tax=Chiloscyllium plagiosum TaxID=36176 RepID=UPI001CB7B394|nr:C-type lectin domain family 11 member A [Chiloscyllium plagiosum]